MSGDLSDKRPTLKVFADFTPKDAHLKPGYAYLIRSSVRMPELYPLLGELLFESKVVGTKNNSGLPPNIIGMFIEDAPDNLTTHLGMPGRYANKLGIDVTEEFGKTELSARGTAAWLDTFGEFHQARGGLDDMDLGDGPVWWRKRIAGAGNPMAVMRFFRLVQQEAATADLNLFLLNSLSNLYRNLKLSESAAFLKTMLSESIWSAEFNSKEKNIGDKSGLFFAVLQEDVLDKQEASYLESFFDGIIKVEPCVLDKKLSVARVHIEVFPELIQSHDDFVYIPMWQYERHRKELGNGWTQEGLKYISTHSAENCVVKGKENGRTKKRQP